MMTEDHIHVNGVDLFCRMTGEDTGLSLILLHGYGQSGRIFRKLERHLTQRYRVISLDSRGHGKSASGDLPLSIPQMAADVIAVIRTLHIKHAVVIGYSDGGNIALQTALSCEGCLKGAVIISGNARPEGVKRYFTKSVELGRKCLDVFSALKIIPGRMAQMTDIITKEPQISDQALQRIQIPILLIFGSRDIVTNEHIAELNHYIPHAETHILTHTGHAMMMNKWEKYIHAIERFLDNIACKSSEEVIE